MVKDGLARIAEAASFLSLSRSKLYGLMDSGEIAFLKIGKSRRISWAELTAFVDNHTISKAQDEEGDPSND